MRQVAVAAIVALLGAPAAAYGDHGEEGRPEVPRASQVRTEIAALSRAVSRTRPVPRRTRRSALRALRRVSRDFRRKRVCPAATRVTAVRRRLVRASRRARGRNRRTIASLATRAGRVRAQLLASAPAGRACGGPPTFDVDRALRPAAANLPGSRPLARVADPYGNEADFVANELWVATDRQTELDAILRRWRGELVRTVDLGIPGVPKQHLVRIRRAARSDAGALPANAQKLSDTRGTATRVSGQAGLDLLAVAAEEAVADRAVGINWVGAGDGIRDGFTREGANGTAGFTMGESGYAPDAYRWKHLASGSTQDIGVTTAWTLLDRVGRLRQGSVPLAILDMGFAPETNGDFPPNLLGLSNVPGFDAIGTMNLGSCSGGTDCPWHGTSVMNAAAGVPDNRAGAAGPAGPIARPIAVFTLTDFFTSMFALAQARAAGARIANMSYSAPVPATLSWTVIPFELTTIGLRSSGMLLFASAGNKDMNVDAEDCFGWCWEEEWVTPCENGGVTCVGALGHDSIARDKDYSNWGAEDVDLWAPGTVLVGPTPRGGPDAASISGTSFAAPYAAGVAALGMAANPDASAGDVMAALERTAKAAEGRGRKYVNALGLVSDLLPRLIVIESPAPDSVVPRGQSIDFTAFVYEDDRGAPDTVDWTLGGDVIGRGTSIRRNDLPFGTHTIVATAIFADGSFVSDRVRVTITNDPPAVEISQPSDGAAFFESETVTFRGASRDPNQPESAYRLRDDQVSWSIDGVEFARGHNATRSLADLSPGPHTVTFRGHDGELGHEQSITITVQDDPPNKPPSITIDEPANPSTFTDPSGPDGTGRYYRDVQFRTTATDPEAGPLTFEWTERVNNGSVRTFSSTAAEPVLRLYYEGAPDGACGHTRHDVTVRVTDDAGNARTDTVTVFVGGVPC